MSPGSRRGWEESGCDDAYLLSPVHVFSRPEAMRVACRDRVIVFKLDCALTSDPTAVSVRTLCSIAMWTEPKANHDICIMADWSIFGMLHPTC